MIIRNYHNQASKRLNLNNPRQTKCSLGIVNQTLPCVSQRRNFKNMQIADNHKVTSINTHSRVRLLFAVFDLFQRCYSLYLFYFSGAIRCIYFISRCSWAYHEACKQAD